MEPNWTDFSWPRVKRALVDLGLSITDTLTAIRLVWIELTEPLWEKTLALLQPEAEISLYEGEE